MEILPGGGEGKDPRDLEKMLKDLETYKQGFGLI